MKIAKDMSDAGPGFNTKETAMKAIILAAAIAGGHAATSAASQTAVLYPWDPKEAAVAEVGSVMSKNITGEGVMLAIIEGGCTQPPIKIADICICGVCCIKTVTA